MRLPISLGSLLIFFDPRSNLVSCVRLAQSATPAALIMTPCSYFSSFSSFSLCYFSFLSRSSFYFSSFAYLICSISFLTVGVENSKSICYLVLSSSWATDFLSSYCISADYCSFAILVEETANYSLIFANFSSIIVLIDVLALFILSSMALIIYLAILLSFSSFSLLIRAYF